MSRIKWDENGSRFFESGVRKCVLFPKNGTDGGYTSGVAWNGITGITETPSGAEETKLYADDIVYGSVRSKETLGGTIEAYTYPDEFAVCDGSGHPGEEGALVTGVSIGQQKRVPFGMTYVTQIDNDENVGGYKLHLLWDITVSPSDRAYTTISDTREPIKFSWEFSTNPVKIDSYKDGATTSLITIDTTKLNPEQIAILNTLEDKLYGTEAEEPTFITPDEVISMFAVRE